MAINKLKPHLHTYFLCACTLLKVISLAARAQFHQHSTYSFYACRPQKRKKILTTWLKSYAFGSYRRKSCVRKMLVKSTPGLNFINVLRTAFTRVDPKSVRIQSNPQYLFTLLGSTCAKAARRTLMKSTPGYLVFKVSIWKNAENWAWKECVNANLLGLIEQFKSIFVQVLNYDIIFFDLQKINNPWSCDLVW